MRFLTYFISVLIFTEAFSQLDIATEMPPVGMIGVSNKEYISFTQILIHFHSRFLSQGQSSTVEYKELCEQLYQASTEGGSLHKGTVHIFSISYSNSNSLHEFLLKYRQELSGLYVSP